MVELRGPERKQDFDTETTQPLFILTDACMFQFTVTVHVLTGWKLRKCNFEAEIRETK